MINRSPRDGAPARVPNLRRESRRPPSRPTPDRQGHARHLRGLLPPVCSALVSPLQDEVTAITSALSWAVLVGNVLASLLFLWAAWRETPRQRLSVLGGGVMLLLALLSGLTYGLVLLPRPAHASLWPTLLPLASSALIAGLSTLTMPQRRATRRTRALLVVLLLGTSATLLALVLLDR